MAHSQHNIDPYDHYTIIEELIEVVERNEIDIYLQTPADDIAQSLYETLITLEKEKENYNG